MSELRRPARADPKVVAWAAAAPIAQVYLSVITVLELELGVALMERRNAVQGGVLRAWLDGQVTPRFAGRLLPVDDRVARRCAGLHAAATRPDRDALIAATALVHGMTVVTRNTADFTGMGVTLRNPWL